jgi:hypothetical protein
MKSRTGRLAFVAVGVALLLGAIGVLATQSGDDEVAAGVTRVRLGQVSPENAPGQVLYLERVTIAPGAKLAEHFHEGTQVARVVSGVLTYNIVSGTAVVTRADGSTEEASGPRAVRLGAGETVAETRGLVHFGANDGSRPVVIELAALLSAGAPLATSAGGSAAGIPMALAANLESQSRTLFTAGAGDAVVYGWNRLAGNATLDGRTVGVDMLGSVDYVSGSGPFSGFITFSFADGSTLGVTMSGAAQASPGGSETAFAATLGVTGGTGRYVGATGTGTFVGSRRAALGTAVAATFDLKVDGSTP